MPNDPAAWPLLSAPQAEALAHFLTTPAAATARAYARTFSRFLAAQADAGLAGLEALTTAAAAPYFEGLAEALAPATVAQHLTGVNRCLDALARAGLLPANPVRSLQRPRLPAPSPSRPALSNDLLAKILRLIPDDLLGLRDRALLTLLGYTGARLGALLDLDVAAIRQEGGLTYAHFPAGEGGTRALPLHPEASAVLATYLAKAGIEAGAIFRTSGWPRKDRTRLGEARLSRNGAWRRIQFLARAAGVAPPTSHAFRQKALTTLARTGIDLDRLRQFAGHRSSETTRAYTKPAAPNPKRVIASLHFPLPPPALRQKIPARRPLRQLLAPWLHGNTLTVPRDELPQAAARLNQSPPTPGTLLRFDSLEAGQKPP